MPIADHDRVVLAVRLVGWQRWQAAAAHNTFTQLIQTMEKQQAELLDAPASEVPQLTSKWLAYVNNTLACPTPRQLHLSPILANLSPADRDTHLQALFEQALPLTWLAVERSAERGGEPSAPDEQIVQLIELLQQIRGTRFSPLSQLLSEHAKNTQSAQLSRVTGWLTEKGEPPTNVPSLAEQIIWARLLVLSGQSALAIERLTAIRDTRVNRFCFGIHWVRLK